MQHSSQSANSSGRAGGEMHPEDNLAKRFHKKQAITAINLPTIPKKPDSKKSLLAANFQLTRKLQEYNLPFLIENDFHFHPEVK